ncbi:hypothetical protein [Christiangramia sp. LLG6405-1]|uniref:hypothetical protein n=1 Tax=Christiangramia sp. LLG6405-1 TaxID=3160832 RepID=UPI00386C6444
MKILSKNSILNRLPVEIEKNRFLIFDAIRFSFQIIEENFSTLETRLLDLSINEKKGVPITFHYTWSIIDYTDRIRELLYQLPWEKPDEIIGDFKHLKDFRNTFQHLGGRGEMIINKKSPLYGILSWFYKDLESREFTPYSLFSGIQRGSKVEWKVPNLKESNSQINSILLQTVAEGKVVSEDLNKIMIDLRQLCKNLEDRLENMCQEKNLNAPDWERRQDILVVFKQNKE